MPETPIHQKLQAILDDIQGAIHKLKTEQKEAQNIIHEIEILYDFGKLSRIGRDTRIESIARVQQKINRHLKWLQEKRSITLYHLHRLEQPDTM